RCCATTSTRTASRTACGCRRTGKRWRSDCRGSVGRAPRSCAARAAPAASLAPAPPNGGWCRRLRSLSWPAPPRIVAAMAFDAFALALAMLALGMLFARLRLFPAGAADTLNLVVLYVCLPAAILVYVPRLRFDPGLLGLVAVPWLLAAAS